MSMTVAATGFVKKMARLCLAIVALALLLVAALYEFGRHANEAHGKVLEIENFQDDPLRWTFKPLPNAEVMAVWYGAGPGEKSTLHSGGHCMGYALTRTAADGSFHFPAWKAPWGTSVGDGVDSAYAAGYVEVRSYNVKAEMAWVLEPGKHFMRRAAPEETPAQLLTDYTSVDGCARVLN